MSSPRRTSPPSAPAASCPAAGNARAWGAWARRRAQWTFYVCIGLIFAIPLSVLLLMGVLLSPRKVLRRVDRSQRRFPDPLPGLLHEHVRANGVSLHLVRTSKRSGLPLMLCVHGFPEFWYTWRRVMEEFRDTHEVVAVDMRGFNESDRPAGRAAYAGWELMGDLIAVEEHLLAECGHEQLLLVAHDWGGKVAWTAAHKRPELLSALIVLCCPHPRCFMHNMDWNQLLRSWYMFVFQLPLLPEALLCANDYAGLQAISAQEPTGTTSRTTNEEDVERYKQAFGFPGAPTATINYYRNMLPGSAYYYDPAMTEALRRKLEVPTLLLWGEDDMALGPQVLHGTERHVEHLQLHILAKCSHWALRDRPEEVHHMMRQFLAEQARK